VLHDYAGGVVRTKLVSAIDVAHALARRLDLASGLLPPDALWWASTAEGERVAVWREPRVWTVRLRERYDAPPHKLRLPMPGLVFVCRAPGQAPYVFAAKRRPKSAEDELYHCPAYNVFPSCKVCTGSHAFPSEPARVPEEFFRSYFSVTGDTARVPIAHATVRGLPPLHALVDLRGGRLPHALWEQVLAACGEQPERELFLAVTAEVSGYRLLRPAQLAGRLRVFYRPPAGALLAIHSHGVFPARFSPTDDADEQGFGLYGVVGRLGDRPEVALRVGVYGYFLPVPWESVFEGDRAPFRDTHFDPPDAADAAADDGDADGVPD
jgi:hypothetical protein